MVTVLVVLACLNVTVGAWLWEGLNVHPPGTKYMGLRRMVTVLFWLPLVALSLAASWWCGGDDEKGEGEDEED